MSSLKNKVTEGVEHAKNVAAQATMKIGHAAVEVLHKSEHAITDAARAAKEVAVETVDKLKHAADKVDEKPLRDGVRRSSKTATNNSNKSN